MAEKIIIGISVIAGIVILSQRDCNNNSFI